jgi:hypothetical protein
MYTQADVAMRFLSILPDLGVIAVVGLWAHSGKMEASTGVLALLAVLAGRLNPAALTSKLGGGAAILPLILAIGGIVKKFSGIHAWGIMWVIMGTCLTFMPVSCAALQKVTPSISKVAVCVLEHDQESAEEIARDCEGVVVGEVASILSASERRSVRRAAKSHASVQDAGFDR